MTSDLCEEDVVQISSPQILSPGAALAPAGEASAPRVAACSAAVELGRRLLLAARAGDTATVLDLMAKGAPFTTDWLGTSPLHLAAANAHVETCAVLLRAGVSRDSRTKVERTPLHLAAHAGHARVVALLLDHGAIVDCRDMLRMTPLHWAAARGHAAAARELLRRGADVRARCKFRYTPRALAARHRQRALVALLDQAEAEASAAAVTEQMAQETRKTLGVESLTKPMEIKIEHPKLKMQQEPLKQPKLETKVEQQQQAAAQLLRKHGITLLPTDDGSTVLSAIQSGRTVVLSDAGKLMLKESGAPLSPSAGACTGTVAGVDASTGTGAGTGIAGAGTGIAGADTNIVGTGMGIAGAGTGTGTSIAGASAGKGVVLTATPVRSPPHGVKVFTLNNKLLLPTTNKIPVKKVINPHDIQQMKFVQLSSEAKVLTQVRAAGAAGAAVAGGGVEGARGRARLRGRPAVKIIVNKTNLNKLMGATAVNLGGVATGNGLDLAAGEAPQPQEGASEAARLRGELAAARAALADVTAQLHACQERLRAYEP